VIPEPAPGAPAPAGPAPHELGWALLISCYELGHQPLGVALPAGFLQRAGFRPALLDLGVDALDPARAREAGFVALSVPMHTALRLGVEAARKIRAWNPGAHLCFYGHYAYLNRDFLLGDVADSLLAGESEAALVELAAWVAGEGAEPPPEAILREPAGREPSGPVLRRLEFELPVRNALPPLEKYAHLDWRGERVPVAYVEASRGCKHLCRHCPIPPVYQGRFFVVPAARALEDIRQQVAAGARHVNFGDPDFLNGPGHARAVAAALHAEFPDVTFDFTAKVEHLLRQRHLLPELRRHGCLFVVTAVESLSEEVLRRLHKGHTPAEVFVVTRLAAEVGIALRPSLVPFTPWSTLDDYLELFDWAVRDGLVDCIDPVQYTIRLLIPPGSLLLEDDSLAPHLEGLDAAGFSWRWRHPDPRMDALQRDASRLVEQDTALKVPPREIFSRLHALAGELAGGPAPHPLPPAPHPLPPRLTESWFC
jgi:radical SAM superfamily enzyme YgiQ (UPF0313 family)